MIEKDFVILREDDKKRATTIIKNRYGNRLVSCKVNKVVVLPNKNYKYIFNIEVEDELDEE